MADPEVTRLCANVSQAQRAWLERHMWYSFPECFVRDRLMVNYALDGTDAVPDEDEWWSAIAAFYKIITREEPPGLVCVERAQPPGDSVHFN